MLRDPLTHTIPNTIYISRMTGELINDPIHIDTPAAEEEEVEGEGFSIKTRREQRFTPLIKIPVALV